MAEGDRWAVTVLLGSDWATLKGHNSRWKQVVQHWSLRDDVLSIAVVDPLRSSRKAVVTPAALVHRQDSWHPAVESFGVTVPGGRSPSIADALGLRRAAVQLRHQLPPVAARRLVVSASPISIPLALCMRGMRGVFDAVDDWRDNLAMKASMPRIKRGYALARGLPVTTVVSAAMAERMAELGVVTHVVPNGAPAWADDLHAQPCPAGLPAGPFAVYVGQLEGRLDVAALTELRRDAPDLPVVMAGTCTPELSKRLTAVGIHVLGPVDASLVPGLLGRASVGLLPHRGEGLSATQSSMKVWEYLAAHLPVASTLPSPDPALHSVHEQRPGESFGALTLRAMADGRGRVGPVRLWSDVADELWQLYTA
jgi:hypothetical protein